MPSAPGQEQAVSAISPASTIALPKRRLRSKEFTNNALKSIPIERKQLFLDREHRFRKSPQKCSCSAGIAVHFEPE